MVTIAKRKTVVNDGWERDCAPDPQTVAPSGAGKREQLLRSALKKAEGYTVTESVDEFSMVDGELQLTKRRVTTKEVPPDTAALRLLLECGGEEREVPIEELERERDRLLKILKGEEDGTD